MRKLLSKILNPIIEVSLKFVVFLVGLFYKYDSYRRYYVLETIARIPYFSYFACLHLYQTLGSHPALELMDLHYKENLNEQWHLMIMEDLGGGKFWLDRIFARVLGFFYYGVNIVLYLIAPESGYFLMKKVETEAVHSYNEILKLRSEEFKNTPAPAVALEYFYSKDGRMTPAPQKRENVTLFDIFESIRDDEQVHVDDMSECQHLPSLYTSTPGIELRR
jgi:ubiquinol oxidase